MKFGNIIYDNRTDRVNLGDDMQLIAVENMYQKAGIDKKDIVRVKYSELQTYSGDYVVLPIAFPMISYSRGTVITGFSERIIPVFLSLCILADVLDEQDVDYLKRSSPIGCRDVHTLQIMRKYGIPSYLNGCMTLTLPKRSEAGSGDHVYLVDVPDSLRKIIPKNIKDGAEIVSPICRMADLDCIPEIAAKRLYERYISDAKLVITTRLHVALPCMAAGLPVVFLKDEYSFRFAGIDAVVPFYSKDQFDSIDWNPRAVDLEKHRNEVLDLSISRIQDVHQKWSKIYDLSSRMEAKCRSNYYVEGVDNARAYLSDAWKDSSARKYAVWGVTQAATSLVEYIRAEHPNAELISVIDSGRQASVGGISSRTSDRVELDRGTTLFICAAAAADDAYAYARARGLESVYNCYALDDALIYKKGY